MSDSNLMGTLSFMLSVVSPETEWRGGQCRWVALARFHGIQRNECDSLHAKFMELNPGLKRADVRAEWTCREIVYSDNTFIR